MNDKLNRPNKEFSSRLLKKLELRPHKNKYWLHKKVDEFRQQKIANVCALYKNAQTLKKMGIITVSLD